MTSGMKNFTKYLVTVITLVMVFTVAGMTETVHAATYKPTSMYLSVSNRTVDIKGKATIKVKSVKPSKASRSVTYKSSNRRIATVSRSGVVTGKRSGTAKITVTSTRNKKLKKVVKITVKNLKATKVSVSCTRSDLYVGEKVKSTARISAYKGYYDQGVYWSTSNRNVATVSSGGTITALSPGKATIKATARDGSRKYGTITINVCDATTSNYINADTLKENLTTGKYVILDVRKANDYRIEHVAGSVSASVAADDADEPDATSDYAKRNIAAAVKKYGKYAKYVLVCYSGNKYAQTGTELLIKNGIKNANIFTLGGDDGRQSDEGGMKAWTARYPQYVTGFLDGANFDFDHAVTADNLKADTDGVYTILDLRTSVEYSQAHIPGAISTPCRDWNAIEGKAGDPFSDSEASAHLKKFASDKNGLYVVICYSGQKFADMATRLLAASGIPAERVITLQGGFSGWTGDTSDPALYIDKEEGTVTITATVNAKFEDGNTAICHLITSSCDQESEAGKALFDTQAKPIGFYDALATIGGTPWTSKDTKRTFSKGSTIESLVKAGIGVEPTHYTVSIRKGDTVYPLADVLKYNGGDADKYVDLCFSGNYKNQSAWNSGCVTCLFSCYSGVASNYSVDFSFSDPLASLFTLDSSKLSGGDKVQIIFKEAQY